MKAGIIISGNGSMIYLTSHNDYMDDALVNKFVAKGITKFVAYEVSVEDAKRRYGGHFEKIVNDLYETDDLRILDFDGNRSFQMFSFKEMGTPYYYEIPNI